MSTFIAHFPLKLIKNMLLLGLLFCISCNGGMNASRSKEKAQIAISSGRLIDIHLAVTEEEKTQGLSGIKDADFGTNEGMFFYYESNGPRKFWMPDTYFNLDIIFLNKEMKILAIEKNVQAHPGRNVPPTIATTRAVYARHVLEVRSDSPLARELSIGQKLIWIKKPKGIFK